MNFSILFFQRCTGIILIALIVTLVFANPASCQETRTLNRKARRLVKDTIVPALLDREFQLFVQETGNLIEKLDSDQLLELEELGRENGIDSLRKHFVEQLIPMIEQKIQQNVPDLKLHAAQFINEGLANEIQDELNELGEHKIMRDPLVLPESWRESEELFWQVHVWKNRLANIRSISEFAVAMQEKVMQRAIKKNDQPTIALLQPALLIAEAVEKCDQQLREREAKLRFDELVKAENVLRTSEDFEERLNAAFVLELDGTTLEQMFQDHPPSSFNLEQLQGEKVRDQCKRLLASGREHGEDVINKAILLRVGSHWWLRGRYGAGPLKEGLLKEPEALNSEAEMFGLYMPRERPAPIGSYSEDDDGGIVPGYDRRHYFTWAVERRDLNTRNTSRNTSSTTEFGEVKTNNAMFW